MWRDVGHSFNLKIKLEQKEQEGKRSHFFLVLTVGEKKRGRKGTKASLFDLQSSIGQFSLGHRTKVHRINDGDEWVPRTRDFVEDPRKEIWEIEVVGLRKLPTNSSTL